MILVPLFLSKRGVGLNEVLLILRHSNTWSSVGGPVLVGLGGMAMLEKLYHWEQTLRSQKPSTAHSCLANSPSCHWYDKAPGQNKVGKVYLSLHFQRFQSKKAAQLLPGDTQMSLWEGVVERRCSPCSIGKQREVTGRKQVEGTALKGTSPRDLLPS